jgi:hypothetical protein
MHVCTVIRLQCILAWSLLIANTALAGDIPPEIAKNLAAAVKNPDNSFAEERLGELSHQFPDAFSSIILFDHSLAKRWMAIETVGQANNDRCDKALVAIFNDPKQSRTLRVPIMRWCLAGADHLTKERLRPFVPGLQLLLKERIKAIHLELTIELAGKAGDKTSIPLLIPLLDPSNLARSISADDASDINQAAHEALQKLTGRTDVPATRSAWEAALEPVPNSNNALSNAL